MSYRELILGAGSRKTKDLRLPTAEELRANIGDSLQLHNFFGTRSGTDFHNSTTLDINADHHPDIQFNLERIDGQACNRIPLPSRLGEAGQNPTPDNYYDEVHAYCVLEHIGRQGDYRKFFAQFSEFWRITKSGGFFFGVTPAWHSAWAWADPSHTRIIAAETLVFLSQAEYEKQVGVTAMSDFRFCYKADWETVHVSTLQDHTLFVLRAVK